MTFCSCLFLLFIPQTVQASCRCLKRGPTGPTGPSGSGFGATGSTGPVGLTGSAGATGVSPTGPQGFSINSTYGSFYISDTTVAIGDPIPFTLTHVTPVNITNSSGAFTISQAGVYEISFGYQATSSVEEQIWNFAISVNGTTISATNLLLAYGTLSDGTLFTRQAASATYMLLLQAGDIVEVVNAGPSTSINAAFINMIRIK